MAFEILLSSFYALLFTYVIYKTSYFDIKGISKGWLCIAFFFKILAGVFLTIIYTKYYTDRGAADVFKFFDDSEILFQIFKENPIDFLKTIFHPASLMPETSNHVSEMKFWRNQDILFNDNQTMIVLNAIFRCFSLGNYYVHVIFINFLSFAGLIGLFHVFRSYIERKEKECFILLMFLPSVLLWGSGLLKDSFLLFALGMMLYFFNKLIYSKYTLRNMLALVALAAILVFIKPYILFILFPALMAWARSKGDHRWGIALKFSACYAICFIITFNIGRIDNKYDVSDLMYYKQRNFYLLADSTKAQSVIDIPKFNPDAGSIIKHIPLSVVRVFVRPSIFDSRSPLILMAAIENLFIVFILLTGLLFFNRSNFKNVPLFWLSVFFVIGLFALTGLITPVLGAIVRYKVPALPFLMFIVISLYDRERIRKVFSVFRN